MLIMYRRAVRERAFALAADGHSTAAISRALGVSRASIREWLQDPARARRATEDERCFRCSERKCAHPTTYAYLLGQYLGDGHLVTSARVPRLRIACADAYPGIAAEVDTALVLISSNLVGTVQGIGCSEHYSYWMHWPCLFPQHGPGLKHTRPIVLASWQRELVLEHPWSLIRGLIHSDGCRAMNRVTVRGKQYAYPRYFFSNESRDILHIMGDALDRVGVAWRFNRPNSISIAKRDAVALMDVHIGPKT